MNRRFILELIVGVALLVSVIVMGQKGMAALALLAVYPFIRKRSKPDEREVQLFNMIGNITAGATLFVSVIVFYFSDLMVNGQTLGDNWLFYVCSAFLISHGLSGLIVFNRK
jgi:hypothetical protein